jgi:S1-C subfamily serine protease
LRKVLLAIILIILLIKVLPSTPPKYDSFVKTARNASVAIIMSHGGKRQEICSGTSVPSPSKDYGWVLTARHCVADIETNEIYVDAPGVSEEVTFADNEHGPFYTTELESISNDDDYALLKVVNGGAIPNVKLADERKLGIGDDIFSWSYPMDSGKVYTGGHFINSKFAHFPAYLSEYTIWKNAYPADILYSHGSSGGGLFDKDQQGLIGVIVGILLPDQMKIIMPASGASYFLQHHVTLDEWRKFHPVAEDEDDDDSIIIIN